jgi:hypothetical protein
MPRCSSLFDLGRRHLRVDKEKDACVGQSNTLAVPVERVCADRLFLELDMNMAAPKASITDRLIQLARAFRWKLGQLLLPSRCGDQPADLPAPWKAC